MYEASRPIIHHIKRTMEMMYEVHTVRIDRNQPHVLKYSAEDKHTGVELHHDKCDLTANIMLSRSSTYDGGGWVKGGIWDCIMLAWRLIQEAHQRKLLTDSHIMCIIETEHTFQMQMQL